MDIHFDKFVPLIIAAALLYFNIKKKKKKANSVAQNTSSETSTVTEKKEDEGIFNPIFKGLEDILNFDTPQTRPVEQTYNIVEERIEQPKAEEIIPEPTRTTSNITSNITSNEQRIIDEQFEFDIKKAIIYKEILERKYFTV